MDVRDPSSSPLATRGTGHSRRDVFQPAAISSATGIRWGGSQFFYFWVWQQGSCSLGRTRADGDPTQPPLFGCGQARHRGDCSSRYNNFYEFGSGKRVWRAAQALPTDPWTVEITGLVRHPQRLGLEDLFNFPLEERIYRFRCVEAWAMVVPWLGFPMRLLLERVDPLPTARFVRFTSFYDPEIMPGPIWPPNLPWPYTEGLRIEEMANELAFFALGVYGKPLPKQHGAPIRMVVPWKYGFKGGKSIVKIEFLARQPSTFWNTLAPEEYGFEANVDPRVPHPRWSQEQEVLIGFGSRSQWQIVPTLPYNGYGEYVAHLYG